MNKYTTQAERAAHARRALIRMTDNKHADRLVSNGWTLTTPEGDPYPKPQTK